MEPAAGSAWWPGPRRVRHNRTQRAGRNRTGHRAVRASAASRRRAQTADSNRPAAARRVVPTGGSWPHAQTCCARPRKSTHTLANSWATRSATAACQTPQSPWLPAAGHPQNQRRQPISRPQRPALLPHQVSAEHLDADDPVIPADTKEKRGQLANGGREYQPKGRPEQGNVHDFPSPSRRQGHPLRRLRRR